LGDLVRATVELAGMPTQICLLITEAAGVFLEGYRKVFLTLRFLSFGLNTADAGIQEGCGCIGYDAIFK
jgi:hypothetical protein